MLLPKSVVLLDLASIDLFNLSIHKNNLILNPFILVVGRQDTINTHTTEVRAQIKLLVLEQETREHWTPLLVYGKSYRSE